MNNILSFNEYNGYELEKMVYTELLNEKSSTGKGIRGFINRRAARKVKSELSDEIEMSKTIMEGIKEGLETLSENFDSIQKSLDNSDDKKKGEKQKLLADITKILENSKKNTWDINELIDEGEIDYTGFTANVGIASVAYFGILLTPFRATVMIHKGYNYFFGIVKNTIRKALVMLQLNFDQFENLIVTQSLRCAGVITASDTSNDISEFYGNIFAQLCGSEGTIAKKMGKNKSRQMEQLLKAAKDKFDQQVKADKLKDSAENLYNNLDPYNNTYTKSLEALRQYSADDVQKYLDAIKSSMSKLAGQEADLQTYSELILAAAEEHAYKVSSSIYNKFAKMTEVFSLPNQQKLIDLILAANKEQKAEAKKIRDEKKAAKELQEKIEEKSTIAEEGLKVFKSLDGVEIEELEDGEVSEDGETVKKYDESKIKADKWTYEEFDKLDKNDQDSFEIWLELHPEVLKKCSRTLRVVINSPYNDGYYEYVDSLIDYISPCIDEKEPEEKNGKKKKNEAYILNFDSYVFESNNSDDKIDLDEIETDLGWRNKSDGKWVYIDPKDKEKYESECKERFNNLIKHIIGGKKDKYTKDDLKKLRKLKDSVDAKYDDASSSSTTDDDFYLDIKVSLDKFIESIEEKKGTTYYLNFNKVSNENQISYLKSLYVKDESKEDVTNVAVVALKVIGKKLLKDKTFVNESENIVDDIKSALLEGKNEISPVTHKLLKKSIEKLEELRDHDYNMGDEEDTKNGEK